VDRVVLWDFDETLAHRPGKWSRCLVDALDDELPGHGITVDVIRPFLRDGFPWHRHDQPHPELSEPDTWWTHVGMLIERAYTGAGVEPSRCSALTRRVRTIYSDPTRSWQLFEDTVPALEALRAAGWRHAVLSNHVPELPALVEGLGLHGYFDAILSSASTGYEKPHPRAFAWALDVCGSPDDVVMVGDNPVADVAGAEAAGIPAILVRRDGAPGLAAVVDRLT